MNKKSVIFHWLLTILLTIAGIGICRSEFIVAGIMLLICAALYLPVPPFSTLWTKSKKSKIATSLTICAILFVSIITNSMWINRNLHPEIIQTAPVSSSSEELSTLSTDSAETQSEESSADSLSIATTSETSTVETTPTEAAATETSGASTALFDLSTVPAYSDSPYAEVNGNVPFFTADELTTTSYETYGEQDSLGRCTTAEACIGQDIMPTEKRGAIGSVKPTGWHTVKYAGIDGNYLF